MTATEAETPAYTPGQNQDCVHVVCVGGSCLYRPEVPTIGPELPVTLRDCEGGVWVRHGGKVLYRHNPDGSYSITTWSGLFSPYRSAREQFPEGPWTVDFAGHWF